MSIGRILVCGAMLIMSGVLLYKGHPWVAAIELLGVLILVGLAYLNPATPAAAATGPAFGPVIRNAAGAGAQALFAHMAANPYLWWGNFFALLTVVFWSLALRNHGGTTAWLGSLMFVISSGFYLRHWNKLDSVLAYIGQEKVMFWFLGSVVLLGISCYNGWWFIGVCSLISTIWSGAKFFGKTQEVKEAVWWLIKQIAIKLFTTKWGLIVSVLAIVLYIVTELLLHPGKAPTTAFAVVGQLFPMILIVAVIAGIKKVFK